MDKAAFAVVNPHMGGTSAVGREIDKVAGHKVLSLYLFAGTILAVGFSGNIDAVFLMCPPGEAGAVETGFG